MLMREVSHYLPVKHGVATCLCGASGAWQGTDDASLCRYYGANAPVYQVDILDTNTMTFHGGELLPMLPTHSAHIVLLLVKAHWEACSP